VHGRKTVTSNYIIIFVTTKDKEEAEKIAQTLLKERLIACANIISSVSSYFWWQDKIESAQECLVILKSRADLFAEIAERLKGLHSYEVPEVLAVPVVEGAEGYFGWMASVLKFKDAQFCTDKP
jgi:periplasmic divalent cation tolerance protein